MIALIAVLLSGALAACRQGAASQSRESAERHNLKQALMFLATCEFKYWETNNRFAPDGSCSWITDDTAGVRVRIQWASSSGFGARATRTGDRADCIYVVGWADSANFMFTSRDHRGGIPEGPVCDGDAGPAINDWRTYDTQLVFGNMNRLVRRMRQYRADHGRFPPQADLPPISPRNRVVWLEPTSWAIETTPALSNGIHCVVWDGNAGAHAPPRDQRGSAVSAGTAVCDSSVAAVR